MFLTVLKTGGEFNERHVRWLQRQIGSEIFCLTDSPAAMPDVKTIPLAHDWPGWWAKMEMFRPDIDGDFLYADLDTVFLKPPTIRLTETHVLADMYGREHMNSGLMFLTVDDRREIWNDFIREPAAEMRRYGGDQDFLNRYLGKKKRFQWEFPGKIVSYKADILKEKPQGGSLQTAEIVVFHGNPRPWLVAATWIPKLD